MSKITRSLSWNTRRKQQRGQDAGADGGEGAEHGTLSPGNGNGVGLSTDGSNGVASMPSEEAYRPSSTPRSLSMLIQPFLLPDFRFFVYLRPS